ncbi:MAG: enoyl-CoA hydratase/isomerase family protein, partial [Rhodospirillales bacterium]|nr:enoyl-CoA hydratase/isomerase family protein [Rhodospirillales bacterium]
MSQDNVAVTREDGTLEIRFDRPEKRNALSRAMYARVVAALEDADRDPAVRVVLLTGTGNYFTSGNDIGDFQQRAAGNDQRDGSPFLTAL